VAPHPQKQISPQCCFQVQFLSHANAILSVDFPDTLTELCSVLLDVTIPIEEVIAGGGGEAKATQRLRKSLAELSWPKTEFVIQKWCAPPVSPWRIHVELARWAENPIVPEYGCSSLFRTNKIRCSARTRSGLFAPYRAPKKHHKTVWRYEWNGSLALPEFCAMPREAYSVFRCQGQRCSVSWLQCRDRGVG